MVHRRVWLKVTRYHGLQSLKHPMYHHIAVEQQKQKLIQLLGTQLQYRYFYRGEVNQRYAEFDLDPSDLNLFSCV